MVSTKTSSLFHSYYIVVHLMKSTLMNHYVAMLFLFMEKDQPLATLGSLSQRKSLKRQEKS